MHKARIAAARSAGLPTRVIFVVANVVMYASVRRIGCAA